MFIVRHGETFWNADKRLQGHSDSKLNAKGLQQAAEAARWLASFRVTSSGSRDLSPPNKQPFTALYASDLSRASETASFAATALGRSVCTN